MDTIFWIHKGRRYLWRLLQRPKTTQQLSGGIPGNSGNLYRTLLDKDYSPGGKDWGAVAFTGITDKSHVIDSGNDGHDFISSGDGDDWIQADWGDDTIDAGTGDDSIYSGLGADSIDAGSGDDSIVSAAGNDSIDAGDGDDTIDAGDGRDFIQAGDGDNYISAGGDHDTIIAGTGDDTISAGDGDDSITSSMGDDSIDAGDGADSVHAGLGNDTIIGGLGDDILYGNQNNDYLKGDEGDDSLYGNDGADNLHGGAGDDHLDAGNGITGQWNRLYGDGGNDTLLGGSGQDSIDGGTGDDSIQAGDGDDRIDARDGNDTLDGGAGNDYLAGAAGVDTIAGGDGDDTIDGGYGADILSGGAGQDTFQYNFNYLSDLPDLISDFQAGIDGDKLDLQLLHQTNLTTFSSDIWVGAADEFAYTHGYINFSQDGANTLVQYDRDGFRQTHNGITIATLENTDSSAIIAGVNSTPDKSNKLFLLEKEKLETGLAEDSSASIIYRAVLGAAPTDTVTLTITGGDQITVNGVTGSTSISFDSNNWWIPQQITIGAADDLLIEGNIPAEIEHTFSSSDERFEGLTETLSVDVIDNDFRRSAHNHKVPSAGNNHIIYDFAGTDADLTGNQGVYSLDAGTDILTVTGSFMESRRLTHFRAEAGNDTIDGATIAAGGDGNDTLITYSTGLNNSFSVDHYSDGRFGLNPVNITTARLAGGTGDDLLQAGNVSLVGSGGYGNDTIFGSTKGDAIYGDYFNDLKQLSNYQGGIPGNSGNLYRTLLDKDYSPGGKDWGAVAFTGITDKSHVIDSGNDGHDFISSGDGDDWIQADWGDDTIDAGTGDDSIYSGLGADSIDAGSGDDSIVSAAGNDSIDAGDGDDTIDAGDGRDFIQQATEIITFQPVVITTPSLLELVMTPLAPVMAMTASPPPWVMTALTLVMVPTPFMQALAMTPSLAA